MAIFQQEDHLIHPEAYHEGALQGNESCDRSGSLVNGIANGDRDKEDNRSDHGDEGQNCLIGTVTCLVLVRLVP